MFSKSLLLLGVFVSSITVAFNIKAAESDNAISIIAYQVNYQNIPQRLEVLGELKAIQSVFLTAKVSDVITGVYFSDGQQVAQSQLLVEFDNQQELAQLREKQISVKEAQKQYYRLKNLKGRANVSQSQIDEQYRDWQVLEAQINTLKVELKDRKILAPFAGQLGLKNFSKGDYIESGEALISLDNTDKMQLDLMVSDRYLQDLKLGQAIEVKSEAYPNKVFSAQIVAISPQLDANSRMIKFRAHIDNPQHALKTNMLVKALIQLPARTELMVPNKSILMLGDHSYVYRLLETDNNEVFKLEQVKIEMGQIGDKRTEILSGLKENDRIISQGVLLVNPRTQVKIKHYENSLKQDELLLKDNKSREISR